MMIVLTMFGNASGLAAQHARGRVRVAGVVWAKQGLTSSGIRKLSLALAGGRDSKGHSRPHCHPVWHGTGGPKKQRHKKPHNRSTKARNRAHHHKKERSKRAEHARHNRAHRKKKKAVRPDGPPLALPVPKRCLSVPKIGEDHHDYPAWDVAVPHGTIVRAVRPGKIIDRTKRGACGKGVIVRGADGYEYTYCHGSKVLRWHEDKIAAGEPLLRSGNTGNSTGPHLHLQIRGPRGRLVCPQRLVRAAYNEKEIPTWQTRPRGCIDR